jgi:hypothetical protein
VPRAGAGREWRWHGGGGMGGLADKVRKAAE